jgi:hypothetical protein
MRERDLDLIVALVEGRLEDEKEARALIESSPKHRREYEAQRTAHQALSSAGTASLSETERAGIRRDVWSGLRSRPTPVVTANPWYYRWISVAAGLFVVVGLLAVLNQNGSPEGGEAATRSVSSTTVAGAAVAETDGSGGSDGSGGTAAVDESEVTPEEGGDSTEGGTLAAEGDGADTANTLSEPSSPSDVAYYEAEAEKVRAGTYGPTDQDQVAAQLQSCLEQSGLSSYSVVGTITPPTDTSTEVPQEGAPFIAAVPEDVDLANAPVAFVDLFSCVLLHLDD